MAIRVVIRANAGRLNGYGHVVRSIALFEAFRQAGHTVTLLTNGLHELVIRAEIPFISNDTKNAELFTFRNDKELLMHNGVVEADILVVDSYSVDSTYYYEAHSVFKKVVAIDDVGQSHSGADVILNGNVYGKNLNYPNGEALILAGPEYCLIRSIFLPYRGKAVVKPGISDVLVMMGGSDPMGLTMKMVKTVQKALPGAMCHVVVGEGTVLSEEDDVDRSFMRLYRNPENLPEIMAKSDFAISAAGSTLYELAYIGIPSLSVTIADNQRLIAEAMHACGCSESVGWYSSELYCRISRVLELNLESSSIRERMSERAKNIFGTNGSMLAVERIVGYLKD